MTHIRFTAFEYDELGQAAKDVALGRLIELHIENVPIEQWAPEHVAVVKEMERMQTPWFLGSELFTHHRASFEEILREQGFLFYPDGRQVVIVEGMEVTSAEPAAAAG